MGRIVAFLCVLAVLAPICAADAPSDGERAEAEEAFRVLFAKEYEAAVASRTFDDDLALARKLLDGAKKAKGQAALLEILCEKAVTLASARPEGYAAAIEALLLEAKRLETKAEACHERVLALRRRHFDESRGPEREKAGEALIDALVARGDAFLADWEAVQAEMTFKQALTVARDIRSQRADDLEAKIMLTYDLKKTAALVQQLESQVGASPDNAALRNRLVRLLVVECDDPSRATRYIDDSCEPELRKYVPAVAKGVDEAPELACLELAGWYRDLAKDVDEVTEKRLLARSQAYAKRFLHLHKEADARRMTAELMLKDLEARLEKLDPKPADKATTVRSWVELLGLIDLRRDATYGYWTKRGKVISFPRIDRGYLYIRAEPKGDYQLQMKFVVPKGGGGWLRLRMPFGPVSASLVLGKSFCGLQYLDGSSASANESTFRKFGIETGRPYVLNVQVKSTEGRVAVTSTLNGRPFVQWSGEPRRLSDYSTSTSSSSYFRLNVDGTTIDLHSLRVLMLTGKLDTTYASSRDKDDG